MVTDSDATRHGIRLATGSSLIVYTYPNDSRTVNPDQNEKNPNQVFDEIYTKDQEMREIFVGNDKQRGFFYEPNDGERVKYVNLLDPEKHGANGSEQKNEDELIAAEREYVQQKCLHSLIPFEYMTDAASNLNATNITRKLVPTRPEIVPGRVRVWQRDDRLFMSFDKTWFTKALTLVQQRITKMIISLGKQNPEMRAIGYGVIESKDGKHYEVDCRPSMDVQFGGAYSGYYNFIAETTTFAESKAQAAFLHVLAHQLRRCVTIRGYTMADYIGLAATIVYVYAGTGTTIPLDKFFETTSIEEQVMKFVGGNWSIAEVLRSDDRETLEERFYFQLLLGLFLARGYTVQTTQFQLLKSRASIPFVHDMFAVFTKPSIEQSSGLSSTSGPFFLMASNNFRNKDKFRLPFPMIIRDDQSEKANKWFALTAKSGISYKPVDVVQGEVAGNPFDITGHEEWIAYNPKNDSRIVTMTDSVDRTIMDIEFPLREGDYDRSVVDEEARKFIWIYDLMSAGTFLLPDQYRLNQGLGVIPLDSLTVQFTRYWNLAVVPGKEEPKIARSVAAHITEPGTAIPKKEPQAAAQLQSVIAPAEVKPTVIIEAVKSDGQSSGNSGNGSAEGAK